MEKLEAMMNMLLEGQEKISTRLEKLEAGQEELKQAGPADLKKEFFELRHTVVLVLRLLFGHRLA